MPLYSSKTEAGGTFLGTIRTLKGTMLDLWVCDGLMGKNLIIRYGNEPEEYSWALVPALKDENLTPSDLHHSGTLGLVVAQEIMFN